MTRRNAVKVAACLVVVACGARANPVPVHNDGAVCAPYLEAAGPLAIPPAGWLTFEPGTPLTIMALLPGARTYELMAKGDDRYRGYGGGRVAFGRAVVMANGVRAVAGASGLLTSVEGDTVGVQASNLATYLVPCEALTPAAAVRRPPQPQPAPPGRRGFVDDESAFLIPVKEHGGERCCSVLWRLSFGDEVDVVSRRGGRVEVRVYRDGYEYQGLVAKAADDGATLRGDVIRTAKPRASGWLVNEQTEEFGRVLLGGRSVLDMVRVGDVCTGEATLRRGAPVLSGPLLTRAAADHVSVREMMAPERDVDVKLLAVAGDYRSVEIVKPAPDVASVIGWVRAADLDDPTCAIAPQRPKP